MKIIDNLMAHLPSRVVIVLEKKGKIVYKGQVPEIVNEPDYQAAYNALEKLE